MGDPYQVDLNTLVASLRALSISRREPITVNEILKDYNEIQGEPLKVKRHGYDTVEEFLQASGKFNLEMKNGQVYVLPRQKVTAFNCYRMQKKRSVTPPPPRTITPTIDVLSSSEDEAEEEADIKPVVHVHLTNNQSPSILTICVSDDEDAESQPEQKTKQHEPPLVEPPKPKHQTRNQFPKVKRNFNRRRVFYRKRFIPRQLRPPPYHFYQNNYCKPPPAPRFSNTFANMQPRPWHNSLHPNRGCFQQDSSTADWYDAAPDCHFDLIQSLQNCHNIVATLRLELFCCIRNIPAPIYNVYSVPYRPGFMCIMHVNEMYYSTNGRSYLVPHHAQVACAHLAIQNVFEWNWSW